VLICVNNLFSCYKSLYEAKRSNFIKKNFEALTRLYRRRRLRRNCISHPCHAFNLICYSFAHALQHIIRKFHEIRRHCLPGLNHAYRNDSAHASRSSPLSTKMHVSLSPMALLTSIAVVEESIPPLSPHITLPSAPTSLFISSIYSFLKLL